MDRIDIFTQFSKHYSHENYTAKQLHAALNRLGIPSKHLCLQEGNLGEYLKYFRKEPPKCTLSFVDLFVGNGLLCDELQAPHFFWSRKGLSDSLHYLSRPLGWVGIADHALYQQMTRWGYPRTTFLPPGIDASLIGLPEEERCYDVIFFDDLVDTEFLERVWKDVFLSEELVILYRCLQECQSQALSPLEALFRELARRGMKLSEIQFAEMLTAIESYLKADYTRKGIESLTCNRIDVFGDHVGSNWLKKLKNGRNVYLHGALPYTEHFEVLKRSKILVRTPGPSSTHFDEWVLPALIQGCMVLQPDSHFSRQLCDELEEGFYAFEAVALNNLVNRHLKQRKSTLNMLQGIREKIIEKNTWEARALKLLEIFP